MFKFTLNDNTEAEFPHFADCGFGIVRKTRKITDDMDRVTTMIELAFGEESEQIKNLDKVPNGTMPEFIKTFMGGLDSKK